MRRTIKLIFECLIIGIRHAFQYGWLAAHTHWVLEKSRHQFETIELACEEHGDAKVSVTP